MRKLIIFFLLPFISVIAQYNSNDYELVKTSFSREFDRDIISSYLKSDNDRKIKAALLSIANSEDTSWIPEILELDFGAYNKSISFALGKLEASEKSTSFLLEQLNIYNEESIFSAIISNLGKTGSAHTLDIIDSEYKNYPGYSFAVFNFFSRNIKSDQSLINLTGSLDTLQIDSATQFETLFTLYRIGPGKSEIMKYVKFIESKNLNNKYFALGCLRKLEAFPDDNNLMSRILQDADWRVRVEALKSCCYKKFNSINEIKLFTSLLYDINSNVSRTAATSLKNIRVTAKLKREFHDLIINLLSTHGFNENTIGEFFISYCSLFPDNIEDKIDDNEDRITPKFVNKVLEDNTDDPNWNFEYLVDQFEDADEKQLMSLIPPFLSLQSKLIEDEKYTDLVLSLFSGDYAAPIALLSYGLDTVFVQKNKEMFQQLIIDQTFKFFNNPYYSESLTAFPVLAGKISDGFKQTVLNTLVSSKIASVSDYAGNKLNENYKPSRKDSTIFENIWENSFKYKKAVVTTAKGSFTITFDPHLAPISVGYFCFLTQKKYFDNVLFHRVVPNFVSQTGDPSSTGWGGPGYEISSEFSFHPYEEAAVGMASAGRDTEGSQWFVMHSYHPHLNGNYSLFGEVSEGMSIVSRIDQGEKIINITLIK